MHVPPGIDVGGPEWTGGKHEHPTVLFTGAMWREANERAVLRLALKVMPGVWQTNGEVRLRIVGARPTPRVRALNRDPRIDVVGHVDSIASEIHAASVIAAPTIYGGGVLMKVTKALGAGAPVVVDQATAQSIGLPSDAAAIVTSDEGFAVALDRILSSPERARRLGANARAFAKNALSWDSVVERYSYAYELAREANQ
jgi:glycosyltransferase involved in cell wall biosynthesis